MHRTIPRSLLTISVIAVAAAVVAAMTGGSARAAGTCPDPFVGATVNIDGTTGPGCRAIITPYDKDGKITGVRYIELPRVAGTVTAHVLAVGAGQSGQLMYAWGGVFAGGFPDSTSVKFGGAGGAGGDVKEKTLTLDSCLKYAANAPIGGVASPEQPEALPGGYFGLPNAGGGAYLWKDRANEPLIQAASATTGGMSPPAIGGHIIGSNAAEGGGGGGPSVVANGGNAGARVAGSPPAGTGGAGATGVDMSAQFPGLADASHLGAGGGAAGVSEGGEGGAGGGYADGATINWTDHKAVPATPAVHGGGGGGGFQYREGHGGAPGSKLFYGAPSNGGDGLLVVDIHELSGATSCYDQGGGGRLPGGGSKPGSGSEGSGSRAASIKASPKVSVTQVPAGGTVTVTLSARNAGTTAAKKARIVFPAPAGFDIVRAPGAKVANGRVATWTVGTLKPRATVKRTVVLQASADAIGRKRIRFSVVSSLGTTHAKAASVWVTGPSSVTG